MEPHQKPTRLTRKDRRVEAPGKQPHEKRSSVGEGLHNAQTTEVSSVVQTYHQSAIQYTIKKTTARQQEDEYRCTFTHRKLHTKRKKMEKAKPEAPRGKKQHSQTSAVPLSSLLVNCADAIPLQPADVDADALHPARFGKRLCCSAAHENPEILFNDIPLSPLEEFEDSQPASLSPFFEESYCYKPNHTCI